MCISWVTYTAVTWYDITLWVCECVIYLGYDCHLFSTHDVTELTQIGQATFQNHLAISANGSDRKMQSGSLESGEGGEYKCSTLVQISEIFLAQDDFLQCSGTIVSKHVISF